MGTSFQQNEVKLRRKEVVRGKLLYYLNLIYPQSATMPLLQAELDYFGFPIPLEELSSHIAYLTEKKMVQLENVRGAYAHRNIGRAKITAHGIDYVEGRLPLDEAIFIETHRPEMFGDSQ